MKGSIMDTELYQLMAKVFEVDISEINAESTMDSIDSWDSMTHLSLIQALEEKFGLQFAEDDMFQLTSVASILSMIQKRAA